MIEQISDIWGAWAVSSVAAACGAVSDDPWQDGRFARSPRVTGPDTMAPEDRAPYYLTKTDGTRWHVAPGCDPARLEGNQ